MDIYKLITDKESEFSSLYSRMDTDKDLYQLGAFKLLDSNNMEVPGVYNVTSNEPRTFADLIISTLVGATMQAVVEGDGLDDKRTTAIEDFLDKIYEAADERVSSRGLVALHPFVCEHICIRGSIAARPLIAMKGKEFVPDILPMDCRYLTYEEGMDGIHWYSYKTTRHKEAVRREYGDQIANRIQGKDTLVEVRDYWDEKRNIIFIGQEVADEQANELGYPPIIREESQSGSLLQDGDRMSHRGESIYASNRNLYEEYNRLLTIINTMNATALFPPMQKEEPDPDGAQPPDAPPYGVRAVIPVLKGHGYSSMPLQDIKMATRQIHAILQSMLQRGGLPNIDYGSLTFPLSAVAISRLTASKDRIFAPRMQAISKFYQKLSMMIIDQYTSEKIRVDLGQPGKTVKYIPTDLKGEYVINYQFTVTDPEQNIANYSIAEAAKSFLSDDTIRRHVLKLEDPDEEKRKRLIELAIKRSPRLSMYEAVKALIEEDMDTHAKILALELGLDIDKLIKGEFTSKEEGVEEPRGTPPIPLMGGRQGMQMPGKSSQKEAAEIATEVEAEV